MARTPYPTLGYVWRLYRGGGPSHPHPALPPSILRIPAAAYPCPSTYPSASARGAVPAVGFRAAEMLRSGLKSSALKPLAERRPVEQRAWPSGLHVGRMISMYNSETFESVKAVAFRHFIVR